MTDPHAYRDAISKDCIIGTRSLNNCLFPYCEQAGTLRRAVDTRWRRREKRRNNAALGFVVFGLMFFLYAVWSALS